MSASGTSTSEEQTEAQQSFAAIQKPHIAESEDQLLVLWGRFWGESAKKAVAFFVQFNVDDIDVNILRAVMYEDESRLDDYDPDQSPAEFKDSLPEDPQTGPNIARADLQIFDQAVHKVLNDRERIKNLRNTLENKNREEFNDWIYEFLSNIITKGSLTYQIKGQLTTRDIISNQTASRSDQEADEETDDEEDSSDDRNYLPINLSTSPMNGNFPADLIDGEEVFVRATGPLVDKLPEDMVDERYDHASIQLEATVTDTESRPSLPGDFDGDPEDYWSVKVQFLKDKYGEGFVHKDEQVKLVNPDSEDSDETHWLLSPATLISTGLTLLGMVVMAYLIFG